MAGINFDATQVAPNAGFSAVEKGKYVVALTQSEFKPTNNGAGKILELHARVNGGANHGRDIMFNLNWENSSAKAVEIGRGRFSAICHAVNVLHVQDTQQLHNIPFVLEVDVTPDGKYNEVIGIYPIGQAAPQAQVQAPVQQPQQFAPVQQPVMQPQFQPQQQQFAPQGQANPMAEYQAMGQPNPNMQQPGFVQQPAPQPQQFAPQPMTQQPAQGDVPDWIRNQQQAAAGNV